MRDDEAFGAVDHERPCGQSCTARRTSCSLMSLTVLAAPDSRHRDQAHLDPERRRVVTRGSDIP